MPYKVSVTAKQVSRGALNLFAIVFVLLMGEHCFASDVFLGVSKGKFQKIAIGIVPFSGSAQNAKERSLAESILKADLVRSQLFNIIVIDFVAGDSPVDLSRGLDKEIVEWGQEIQLSAIAWAKMYTANGKWIMEAYGYETSRGDSVIRVKITGDNIRALSHRFSDKLVSYFTGESGIAETKIAYLSQKAGSKEVYIMDYDGENAIQMTSDASIILAPRWSFNAARIGYTSYRHGFPDIYLLELATGRRNKLFSSRNGLSLSPSWSPSGEWIAFASTKGGNSDIYKMRPDGTDITQITFHASADLSPTWSPTGQEIAFTSDRGGGPQIYIMDAEGGSVRRLTYSGDYNTSPSWSPQGDWLVYACRNKKGFMKLCLDRVDGRELIKVSDEGDWDDESPSWAANGREIVFQSSRYKAIHIFTIRPNGEGLMRLTSAIGNHTGPAWAPR
ncbi:MAG: Tol-Pal system beta propeller repeat protein TolB [Nitrospirota bacterium]